jgi:flagellar hook-associated protein 3 FlgL
MSSLQSVIDRLQAQVSGGKKIVDPSDDPVGASRVAQLQRTIDDNLQYVRNIDAASTKLTTTDNALETMALTTTRVRELALVAANGTNSEFDRKNVLSELDQLRVTLLATANTRDVNGGYVFAGARVGSPAFVEDADGRVVYQGAGRVAEIPITPTATVRAVETGDDLFTMPVEDGRRSVFDIVDSLRELLALPDPRRPEDQAGYDQALTDLDTAIGQINDSRAVIGGRLNRIEAESDRLQALGVALEEGKSRIESADLASAITELQGAMLILKASQQSFAQIKQLSLFDAIR